MNKSMMQHSAHGALMIGHGSAEEFSMASSSSLGSGQRDSSGSSSQLYAMSSSSSTYCPDRCSNPLSGESSPCNMSPWHHSVPPGFTFDSSNWSQTSIPNEPALRASLLDSLVREEGHIYSIAAARPLLYTGSDSKNIRVWKDQTEYSAFKSSSGLVKAIIIIPGRILTGHQDGKIRLWRISSKDPAVYKRAGSLPRLKDLLKYSLKPSSYVEVRRRKTALWIRHCDAVSCLSFSHEDGLLYSGSWDRTFKAWRITDSKCLESIVAHEDAINAVIAAGFDAIVFTGSADGTVKVWRREMLEGGSSKVCRHKHVQTLLKQDSAVTALAINAMPPETVYSSSSDGAINFWEWNGEKKILDHGGVLRGHKQAVLCLTAAGRLVLSGSADKTIWVWRREGAGVHSCLAILSGHAGPVKCLAVHEEGEEDDRCCDGINGGSSQQEYAPGKEAPKVCRRFVLYSGSLDKSVKVWQILELQPPNGMVGIPYF